MGNTNIRVAMNQMNIKPQPTAAASTLDNNLLSFNSSNNNSASMSTWSWNKTNNSNNRTTDKAVALSAQEINEFLR